MKSQYGFSMVELMAVVAIIGITSALAAPNVKKMLANEHTRETAEKFHIMIKTAQTNAKKSGRMQFIKVNGSNSAVTRIYLYDDTNNNSVFDGEDQNLEVIQLDDKGVKIGPSKGFLINFDYAFVTPNTPCSFCNANTVIGIDNNSQLYSVAGSAGKPELTELDFIYANFVPEYDADNDSSEQVRLVLATSTGLVNTWTN